MSKNNQCKTLKGNRVFPSLQGFSNIPKHVPFVKRFYKTILKIFSRRKRILYGDVGFIARLGRA